MNVRVFTAVPAVRESVPLLVGLTGPSGGGKTFSALRLATGIQTVTGGDIYAIDTEARRMLHYADRFKFRHIQFDAPFGSLDYLAAIRHCAAQGAKIIIVDSMSHEHEGPGGLLDYQAHEFERLGGRDAVKMLAWQKPKAARQQLLNGILQIPANFIFCFRAKEKIKMAGGKVIPQGFMPIAGEEFVFEMTLNALLLPGAEGVPTWQPEHVGEKLMSKLPEQFRSLAANPRAFDEKMGADLATWARGGVTPRAQTQPSGQAQDDFPGDRREPSRDQAPAPTQDMPLPARIAAYMRRVSEATSEVKLEAVKRASEKLRADVDMADPEKLLDMDEAYEARLAELRAGDQAE